MNTAFPEISEGTPMAPEQHLVGAFVIDNTQPLFVNYSNFNQPVVIITSIFVVILVPMFVFTIGILIHARLRRTKKRKLQAAIEQRGMELERVGDTLSRCSTLV